ncbi:hypothetical protein NQD34_012125 [Periophthalmus magnuspinnatus]|nr:hypothetical protein NQD34_012125 [Periophthalmus magnuspinnatus]
MKVKLGKLQRPQIRIHLRCLAKGHHQGFHNIEERSVKKWMKACQTPIKTNKMPILSSCLTAALIWLSLTATHLCILFAVLGCEITHHFESGLIPLSLSPHSVADEELTDNVNGKEQDVHRLPPPTPCPVNSSGEPINLRIPPTDKPAVKKPTDKVPSSGSRISDHMVRWKKIRQKWKECSNKNQLRYSESIKILKEMKELYDH